MELVRFNFNNSQVRVIERGGEPWFVAKDVAGLLGYTNPQKAVRDHCKAASSIGVNKSFTLDSQTIVIPERDVYRLIMRSKLPEAQKFEEWVVGEVLPSIRQTGSYGLTQIDWSNPQQIAGILAQSMEKIQEQNRQIEVMKPQADAYHRIATSDGALCITNAAKDLQVRPKDLFHWLSANKWIYRRPGSSWTAYQDKIQRGLLEHKVTVVSRSDGSEKTVEQVKVTPKGLVKLSEQLLSVA
ncbi:phage antirepressor KilAC domain-containing protein [Spartinivicinus ruber]|uniref:phage antirepressor KilAC domain-containing protein n=1 Tax=Spartinivicinus ruber TaxID=2683272 RepID=UPI001CA39353|nr:phage antirepressor KilAC domain-containing protein [Spartinivicinus ruber]